MKIVFVSDAIYPYNKGGKEKRLYELSTRLVGLGHDVHIYTMHWWQGPEKTRTEDGVGLHAISRYYDMYHGDRRSIKEGALFGLACLKLLLVKFDVLDVDHMPFFPVFSAWIICWLRGKKLYGTWHEALSTHDWVGYMGKSGLVAAVVEKLSIKLPYRITAASERTKLLLATYHHRVKRVDVVASGVDFAAINDAQPAEDTCDVLYVGRLVKDKHVDVLIKAMGLVAARDPKIRCIVIGHGIERTNLERLVSDLKLSEQVKILDPIPNAADVYGYMKQAKVFVLPSVREGFGIVALEALSCGTPVVTVNAPANAAKDLIVEGETGSVVELDEKQIADAVIFWVSTGRKLTAASQLAAYDWNTLAVKQAEVYAAQTCVSLQGAKDWAERPQLEKLHRPVYRRRQP
jgi:glycosyltransferase involved in cell wall biosynthesis